MMYNERGNFVLLDYRENNSGNYESEVRKARA